MAKRKSNKGRVLSAEERARIEEITKDPIKAFDYFNERLYGDMTEIPQVRERIERGLQRIESGRNDLEKYVSLGAYMAENLSRRNSYGKKIVAETLVVLTQITKKVISEYEHRQKEGESPKGDMGLRDSQNTG